MIENKVELVPYHPVIKAIFYLQIAVGLCWVGYLLWTGVGVISKRLGDNFYLIGREQSPYSYWFLLAGISLALIGLAIRYLWQGGMPKKQRGGNRR